VIFITGSNQIRLLHIKKKTQTTINIKKRIIVSFNLYYNILFNKVFILNSHIIYMIFIIHVKNSLAYNNTKDSYIEIKLKNLHLSMYLELSIEQLSSQT